MTKGPGILIVDDEEGIRHGLANLFRREEYTVHAVADYGEALTVAARDPLDVAIVDLRLRGDRSGVELLAELKRLEPDLIVIIVTGFGSIDTAVSTLKGGAADYFLKPIDNAKLLDAVRRNLELRSLTTQNRFLRDELRQRCLPHEFVTRDAVVRDLIATADMVKDTTATVLLTGESGTGKEVLARHIHFTGARRDGNLVSINCAALSESLLLSELFGHERGAFTGAVERKRGKFELADGGTLFLDEIGDMSLDVQAKVLRVIEEASFERVGGVKRICVDARIVAATNRDLAALIREGKFREDLFYRIHVVTLALPPLRARKDDIPVLVEHFLAKYGERYNRNPPPLSPEAMAALLAWDWPGNVRELENTVNQIVLLGEKRFMAPGRPGGRGVPVASGGHRAAASSCSAERATTLKAALDAAAQDIERRMIGESLERNDGNKSKTARDLAITRKTLAQMIERLGLSP